MDHSNPHTANNSISIETDKVALTKPKLALKSNFNKNINIVEDTISGNGPTPLSSQNFSNTMQNPSAHYQNQAFHNKPIDHSSIGQTTKSSMNVTITKQELRTNSHKRNIYSASKISNPPNSMMHMAGNTSWVSASRNYDIKLDSMPVQLDKT